MSTVSSDMNLVKQTVSLDKLPMSIERKAVTFNVRGPMIFELVSYILSSLDKVEFRSF